MAKAKPQKLTVPEKHIQASFIEWRDLFKNKYPILNSIFAVPNGFWTENKLYAEAMRKQGLTSGIQDVLCLAPSVCSRYHGLLIEFKTDKGKPSDAQIFFKEHFAGLGYRTEVCRSAHTASVITVEHLGLKIPVYPK